jgi:hypothetical protein
VLARADHNRRAKVADSKGLKAARKKPGISMAGGRYPIRNAKDAMNARHDIGRTPPGERAAVRAHIARREKALGITGRTPASKLGKWKQTHKN